MVNKVSIDGFQRPAEKDAEISMTVSKLFSSPSGKEVLRYLRSITIEMVNGPNVSTDELRHLEGQRYLVGLLERRIQHGHKVKNERNTS